MESTVTNINLENILLDTARFQARAETVDARHVHKLVETWDIRKCSPLLLWPADETGKYYLLSGHHRLHAARALDLETLPAQIITGTESEAIEIAVTDNFGRLEYNPVEFSEIVHKYKESGETWETIKNKISKSVSQAQDYYNLYFCSGLIKERVTSNTMDYRAAAAIGKAAHEYGLQEERQNEFLESCINKRDYSLNQLKETLKRYAPRMVQDDLFGLEYGLSNEATERREIEKKLTEARRGRSALGNLEKYGAHITVEMRRAMASLDESVRRYTHELNRYDAKLYGEKDPGPYKRNNRRAECAA